MATSSCSHRRVVCALRSTPLPWCIDPSPTVQNYAITQAVKKYPSNSVFESGSYAHMSCMRQLSNLLRQLLLPRYRQSMPLDGRGSLQVHMRMSKTVTGLDPRVCFITAASESLRYVAMTPTSFMDCGSCIYARLQNRP
jgi:hypothetical protein